MNKKKKRCIGAGFPGGESVLVSGVQASVCKDTGGGTIRVRFRDGTIEAVDRYLVSFDENS